MTDVFISYKREQRELVFKIYERLRSLKLDTWFDAHLVPGQSFISQINRVITEAKYVVVCWSADAVISDFVISEAEKGLARKALLPLVVQSCDLEKLPPPFNILHTIDLTGWDGASDHEGWQSFLRALGTKLNRDLVNYSIANASGGSALVAWRNANANDPLAASAEQAINRDELTRLERELSVVELRLLRELLTRELIPSTPSMVPSKVRAERPSPGTQKDALRGTPEGAKRILSIEGSQVRAMFSLGVLSILENELKRRYRRDVVIAEYFDVIGSCSLSSAIALALSLGWTVEKTVAMYRKLAVAATREPRFSLGVFREKYSSRRKRQALDELLPDLSLHAPEFKTTFSVSSQRIDAGVSWTFSNSESLASLESPAALNIRDVVMAASAAPFYYKDVALEIAPGEKGIFIDTSSSKGSDRSMELFMETTHPDHGFGWSVGASKLMLLSVGSGWREQPSLYSEYKRSMAPNRAALALHAGRIHMKEAIIAQMQTIGATGMAWHLDTYLHQPTRQHLQADALLDYQLVNMRFSNDEARDESIARLKGRRLSNSEIERLACDEDASVAVLDELYTLGRLCGSLYIGPSYPRKEFEIVGG